MRKKGIVAGAFALLAILLNIYIFNVVSVEWNPILVKILLCAAVDAVLLVCVLQMKPLFSLPLSILRDKGMFFTLAKNDFQAKFAGSYLGLFWAYVQPLITIALYWFVFQVGLRSGDVSSHPFILYLMAGLVPWFYFAEAWGGASTSLIEYNYLVKKVVFNVGLLPAIKVVSALFVHVFFVAAIVIISICYGYGVDLYLLQLPYYMFCTAFLVLGLSHITSACSVFFRDMTQIVNIFLTIGVWLTPIMWNPETTMNGVLQTIFKLNPVYYIVDGFRDAILEDVWFWEKPMWSIFFWCFSILVYLFGVKMFNRLKVHFSDVL